MCNSANSYRGCDLVQKAMMYFLIPSESGVIHGHDNTVVNPNTYAWP